MGEHGSRFAAISRSVLLFKEKDKGSWLFNGSHC